MIQHIPDKRYGSSFWIESHSFNGEEEGNYIITMHQNALYGSGQKRYPGFNELVEREPEKHMKEIIKHNFCKTVGGKIQMYKFSLDGKIVNMSE